ncbi:DUF6716 putative glycosyltransferase [Microbacterium stercoris]|uniref:Uncharacterized protein n=1 Tax=Microbacterium stercoris TaxID=2820289 RepID=A0A939TNA1_9MICO|nr:DUF6716 putative glycosyltransferase [Microbacterium stercoris]MBO3664018.1 hypothetical protein [Microbacterium stercoris]
MRILGLAESDSYLKWAAALLGRAPSGWETHLRAVQGALAVSTSQLRAAVDGTPFTPGDVTRIHFARVAEEVRRMRPDAVLVAATGPLARLLMEAVARVEPRPVLVSGLPGISIPATRLALDRRHQADLMILHSTRELREFGALAAKHGWDHRLALSTLPFAQVARADPAEGAARTDLVFAAQAKVPRSEGDRTRIARMLVRAAQADPSRRVVLKLRGLAGEQQTHHEDLPYPELLARLGSVPPNLVVATDPMGRALQTAQGLVTVSSTAAIEAVTQGVPVIALDAFGVSARLINTVFVGSGLFGDEDDVIARRFRTPDAEWLADNYFHDPSQDDWADVLMGLVRRRREGSLPRRDPLPRGGGALREAWHRKRALGDHDRSLAGALALVVGVPARAAVRTARRVTRRVRAAASDAAR